MVEKRLVGAISIHVDDLSVIGEDSWVSSIILSLGRKFKIGVDNELTHFLSLKITRDKENCLVYLSQASYIEDIQACFMPDDLVSVTSPTDGSFKDLSPQAKNEDQSSGPYPQLIGSLLWLAQCTRPDVSFVFNCLSQFLQNPSNSHWLAAVQIL
jgi:hypothetical protein